VTTVGVTTDSLDDEVNAVNIFLPNHPPSARRPVSSPTAYALPSPTEHHPDAPVRRLTHAPRSETAMTQIAPRPRPGVRTPLLREVYGRLLRGLRTRQGRTLAEVAARAGISVAYLSEVERGLKEPSSEVLEAVCVALGSSITGLVGAAHRELRDLDGATGGRVLDLTSRAGSSIASPAEAPAPTGTLADTTGSVLLAA